MLDLRKKKYLNNYPLQSTNIKEKELVSLLSENKMFNFTSGSRILFLGEGNFSFSANYVKNIQVNWKIVD